MSAGSFFKLDKQKLESLAQANAERYAKADPFPHIVLDDFFPPEALRDAIRQIPGQSEGKEKDAYHTKRKAQFNPLNTPDMGQALHSLLYELNSSSFLSFLEKITGIPGLIPDPYYLGGGVHQIRAGGFLKIHADFNWHERLKLDRRVNILLYLNEGWQDAWGGQLELWSTDMKEKRVSISPIFNRLAIFSTTDNSFHGHPDPLACPEEVVRNSIALYYYTNGRPASERTRGKHLHTLYRERPAEEFLPNRMITKMGNYVPSFVFRVRDAFKGK
jgi:Rps23 Pro-64 3,4-dihydroxylase Tpa1-like proline 4-hydroxylase